MAMLSPLAGAFQPPVALQPPALPAFGQRPAPADRLEIRFGNNEDAPGTGDEDFDKELGALLDKAEREDKGQFAPFKSEKEYIEWISRVLMVNTAGHIGTEDAAGNPVPFTDFVVGSRLEDAVTRAFVVARAHVLNVPDFEGKGPELDPYEMKWETLAEMMGLDPAGETEESTFNILQTRTIDEMRNGAMLLDDEDRVLFDEVIVPLVGGYPEQSSE